MAAVYEEIPQFRSSTREDEDEDDVNNESHRAPIQDDNQDEDDDDREEEGEMKDDENQLPPPPQTRTMMDKKTDPMAKRNMDLEPVRAAGRTMAVYIPPAKRKRLQQQQQQLLRLEDGGGGGGSESDHPSSMTRLVGLQQQEETWRDQQRVIHGTINRLNAQTIKPLIQELFLKVNLIRMRGVLCKSTLAAALSSPKYSNVYAALISVVNSKLPEVGELVVNRSILAFRRHYQRREKGPCQAVCVFMAHLFHQAVVHELLILQLLSLLLDGDATDDSVEVAVELLQTTGHALLEVSPAGVRACVDRVRSLLSEGQLNKRVQHKMEQLLKMRKNGFREFPPMAPELDLVERDDQITHETTLDDEELQKEEHLDTFQENPDYEELEKEWAGIRAEILGEEDDNDSHSGSSSSDDENDDDGSTESGDDNGNDGNSEPSVVPDQELATTSQSKVLTVIQDLTEEDLIHLRRTIYLTIMSSATFEECAHKLARIEIPAGREMELVNMLIECCSQERTFLRYYGLIASRFCLMADRWRETFMESFKEQYTTIHRLETNKLRNVAKLFAHVLHTDAIPWSVLEIIHLNEDETTSSSRIFIKIVIQEMAEAMGIAKLKARLESVEGEGQVWYAGMFPKDNVRNTRYAINFFTSIGLGPLTDDLREFLKNAPKLILAKAKEAALAKKGNDSDSSSVTSSSSSSSSGTSSSTSSSGSSSGSRSSFSSRSSSSGSSSSSHSSSSSYTSYSSQPRKNSSKRRGGGRRSRSYSSSSSSTTSNHNGDSRRRRAGKGDRKRRDSPSRSASPPQEVVTRDDVTSDVLNNKGEGQKSQKDNSRSSTRGRSRSPSPEKRKRRRSPSSSRSRSESRSQSFRGEPSRRREEGGVGRKSPVDEPKGRSKRHRRRHSSSSSSRSRSSRSDSRH